jgi:hypothetical protein
MALQKILKELLEGCLSRVLGGFGALLLLTVVRRLSGGLAKVSR